ncbi:MAG: hypothetical protein KDD37_09565 [Bdellovibrionales bacterium]|nr:hypothetical protein [Bdellovibrionales bacterium]
MKAAVLDLKRASRTTESYKTKFDLDDKFSVRICSSVAHALTESAKGLFRLYPHKLQIGLVTGQSPYLSTLSERVARDGVKVLEFSAQDKADEILSVVSDETCFFILSEDHPISGEIFEIENLVKKLTDKKIFTIILRHNSHLLKNKKIDHNPYVIEIRDHESYGALLLGSRSKKIDELYLAPTTNEYAFTKEDISEHQSLIESFEDSLQKIGGINCYFNAEMKRVWDRTVFNVGKNSEPLYQFLKSHIVKGHIICTSKCTYDQPFNYAWWNDSKFSVGNMNQWLVLDHIAINEVKDSFSKVYKEFISL